MPQRCNINQLLWSRKWKSRATSEIIKQDWIKGCNNICLHSNQIVRQILRIKNGWTQEVINLHTQSSKHWDNILNFYLLSRISWTRNCIKSDMTIAIDFLFTYLIKNLSKNNWNKIYSQITSFLIKPKFPSLINLFLLNHWASILTVFLFFFYLKYSQSCSV